MKRRTEINFRYCLLRGRSGLVPGFVPAGLLVVAAAGVVDALLPGWVVPVGAVVLEVPMPLFGAPAGVAVGVDGGSDVSGVGSGGNGFDTMVAIN